MNCERAQELISGCMDGDITPHHLDMLQEHLPTCAACRRTAEQFEAMQGGFEWLADHSERAIAGDPPRRRVVRFSNTVLAASAAIAAALLIAVGLQIAQWEFGSKPVRSGDQTKARIVEADQLPPEFRFELVGESADDYIAVPQETSNPRVHIVWLHPIFKSSDESKESSDRGLDAESVQTIRRI